MQRPVYPAPPSKWPFFAIIGLTAIGFGCASWIFSNPFDDAPTSAALLLELDAYLTAYENASVPPDATPEQLLAFQAIQLGRRALILRLLSWIESTNPSAELDIYRNQLAQVDLLEPTPE